MNSVSDKTYKNLGNRSVLSEITPECKFVLDVGCGIGDNAYILTKNGITVDGITLSTLEAEEARKVCRAVYIFDLEKGLPDDVMRNHYDAVICSHVLEHIC